MIIMGSSNTNYFSITFLYQTFGGFCQKRKVCLSKYGIKQTAMFFSEVSQISLFIYLFIYLFVYLFIYLFIYSGKALLQFYVDS